MDRQIAILDVYTCAKIQLRKVNLWNLAKSYNFVTIYIIIVILDLHNCDLTKFQVQYKYYKPNKRNRNTRLPALPRGSRCPRSAGVEAREALALSPRTRAPPARQGKVGHDTLTARRGLRPPLR